MNKPDLAGIGMILAACALWAAIWLWIGYEIWGGCSDNVPPFGWG